MKISDYLKSPTINVKSLRNIQRITLIPWIDKNRLLIVPETGKIYYLNDFNQEVELIIQENINSGEYQVLVNGNIMYDSSSNNANLTNDEGNSNAHKKTRSLPGIKGLSEDEKQSQSAPINPNMSKAAFVKMSFLLVTIILVSITIASLLLLFK